MITPQREDENICRQCSLSKEGDCECRCKECGANTWSVYKCIDCTPEEHEQERSRLAQEAHEYYAMVAERSGR